MVKNVSSWSGKFPYSLEIFLTVWKVYGQCRKFPDCLETFQPVWNVSEQSGNFPDKYCIVCSIVARSISYTFVRRVSALWHLWRDNDLRTFGTYMSRKRFTHFCRIYVAYMTIYALRPSGEFLRMKFCQPESSDFLCLWLEKSQANATNVTMHFLMQAIWGPLLKHIL